MGKVDSSAIMPGQVDVPLLVTDHMDRSNMERYNVNDTIDQ